MLLFVEEQLFARQQLAEAREEAAALLGALEARQEAMSQNVVCHARRERGELGEQRLRGRLSGAARMHQRPHNTQKGVCVCECACVRVCVCVRACVRACVGLGRELVGVGV